MTQNLPEAVLTKEEVQLRQKEKILQDKKDSIRSYYFDMLEHALKFKTEAAIELLKYWENFK